MPTTDQLADALSRDAAYQALADRHTASLHGSDFQSPEQERLRADIRRQQAERLAYHKGWNVDGRYAVAIGGQPVGLDIAPRFDSRKEAWDWLAANASPDSASRAEVVDLAPATIIRRAA